MDPVQDDWLVTTLFTISVVVLDNENLPRNTSNIFFIVSDYINANILIISLNFE